MRRSQILGDAIVDLDGGQKRRDKQARQSAERRQRYIAEAITTANKCLDYSKALLEAEGILNGENELKAREEK